MPKINHRIGHELYPFGEVRVELGKAIKLF